MRRVYSLLAALSVAALAACNGGAATPPRQATAAQSSGHAQARSPQANKKVSAGSYTLFGDAVLVSPGDNSPNAVQLSYDPSGQPFGGVDYGIPSNLTVSGLNTLSTDFKFTQGTCSQGSPRFQINVDGANVFVYLGPQFPSVTNPCAGATYSNSTNVISPTSLVDATQLGDGYETWSAFQAQHGSDAVTGIQLVVDGFLPAGITAQFDNTNINGTVFTYDNAESCKKGGWQQFTSSPGPFKNQGDCVSYFNNGK